MYTVHDMARGLLDELGVSSVPVVSEDGKLLGALSVGDLMRHAVHSPAEEGGDDAPTLPDREVSAAMVDRFGLVGAPGGMFSSAPEASTMVRLTAAVTLDAVERLGGILEAMVEEARRQG